MQLPFLGSRHFWTPSAREKDPSFGGTSKPSWCNTAAPLASQLLRGQLFRAQLVGGDLSTSRSDPGCGLGAHGCNPRWLFVAGPTFSMVRGHHPGADHEITVPWFFQFQQKYGSVTMYRPPQIGRSRKKNTVWSVLSTSCISGVDGRSSAPKSENPGEDPAKKTSLAKMD